MHNSHQNSTNGHGATDPLPESEILIGRIIDGEASAEDRARFEHLANINAQLWRTLATRQQDMAVLTQSMSFEVSRLERIELPLRDQTSTVSAAAGSGAFRLPWAVAISGWAAMIGLALVWWFTGLGSGNSIVQQPHNVQPAMHFNIDASMNQHIQEYLRAPFVLGEQPPTMVDVDELSDGRIAIRFLRRIEEIAFLPPGDELPVDEEGRLTKPPAELRLPG